MIRLPLVAAFASILMFQSPPEYMDCETQFLAT